MRNFTGGTIDAFKSRLDSYIQTVPDQPLIPGYTVGRRIETNSLTDWANYLNVDNDNEGARGLREMHHAARADLPDSP